MNVVHLPLNGQAVTNKQIADHLREIALWTEEGRYDEVTNVFVVMEAGDGQLIRHTCGHRCDRARAIGVLMCAATRAAMDGDA